MDLDVYLVSNVIMMFIGGLALWVSQRLSAARRLAARAKIHADAENILRGLRQVRTSAMERLGLREARLAQEAYRPRHAAWLVASEVYPALTTSTAEVPTILPQRIPGKTFEDNPPPEVVEVFS